MRNRMVGVLMIIIVITAVASVFGSVCAEEKPNTTKAIEENYKRLYDTWNKEMSYELFQRLVAEASFAHLNGKWYWGAFCVGYVGACYDDLRKIAQSKKERDYYEQKFNHYLQTFRMYLSHVKDLEPFMRVLLDAQKYYEASKTRDATVKKIRTFILMTK